MKKTITKQDFINEFENSYRKENFSYQGLEKLFDYFEQFEEETGEQIELDIIAICCEYTEFASIEELKNTYDFSKAGNIEKYLRYRTQVVSFENNCILIKNY